MHSNPFGSIREGKVYLNAFREFPEREIGEVKEDEATTISYFEERFGQLDEKVAELEQKIDTNENKGSFLMKLLHMKEQILQADALGDFDALLKRLEVREEELNAVISLNREKNLQIKSILLAEAQVIKDSAEWKTATAQLKELKQKWIKTGAAEKERETELQEKFDTALKFFFDRKKAFYEEKHVLIEEKIALYKQIIAEVKTIASELSVEQAAEKVKALQEKWKTIGFVPAKIREELYQELKAVTDPLFDEYKKQRKAGKQKKSFNLEDNFIKKQALLEQAEMHATTKGAEAYEEIKDLQQQWKACGKVSKDKAGSLNEAFFYVCDLVHEQYFLNKLASAKNKQFFKKDQKDQSRLKLNLLRDLLSRDERELDVFQENLGKLNVGSVAMDKMVQGKLKAQERKIAVKKALFKQMKQELVELNENKSS